MKHITISIAQQTLSLFEKNERIAHFPISSAAKGVGFEEGSNKTPLGQFKIDEKHGFEAPIYTIFKSRQAKGIWQGELDQGDLILTRILWLSGTEEKNANTKQRFIYIHGTNQEALIGSPQSCGCIRMKNEDVLKLYSLVGLGTRVTIA
jgi:lipoprotein-anchoring transpeptidase ErfK/SrfK